MLISKHLWLNQPREVNLQQTFDIVIVGGGFVGASLAIALADSSYKIAILDVEDLTAPIDQSRTIGLALNYHSCQMLTALGLDQRLYQYSEPMTSLHVSDQGHFGDVLLSAEDAEVPFLGRVISQVYLKQLIRERLLSKKSVTCFSPVSDVVTESAVAGRRITFECQGKAFDLQTALLVGADGAASTVRQSLGVAWQADKDHQQTALLAEVVCELPCLGRAYERFTKDGAIALLPLLSGRHKVVWTLPKDTVLDQSQPGKLLAGIQDCFGYRLGELSDLQATWQLKLSPGIAAEQIGRHWVLLGNAAHSLHPIAAQGLNLGLREVAMLVETLMDIEQTGQSCGDLAVLQRYLAWLEPSQQQTIELSQQLLRVFGHQLPGYRSVRKLALLGLEYLPGLKYRFARKAMGELSPLPKLFTT